MPSYFVAENNGSVNVCAVITELPVGGYEAEINVFLTSINGTNAGLLKQTGKNIINIFKNISKMYLQILTVILCLMQAHSFSHFHILRQVFVLML